MTTPFLLSLPGYPKGIGTTHTTATHQIFSCSKKTTEQVPQQLPCLQTTENIQLWPLAEPVGHPRFYGCLNQQYIEKNCAAQAQSICMHSAWPDIPSEQQAGGGHHPSSGLSCLDKHGFGVDVRSFVPSVVPNAVVSVLQLFDTGTVESDVMDISYWNGFYFVILSTFSRRRWTPRTTCCSPQWWFPGWVPGMCRRRERIWSHDKKKKKKRRTGET